MNSIDWKSINWRKGFFRLILILSVPVGIWGGIMTERSAYDGSFFDFLIGFLVFYGLTWLTYFAVRFVIRGFANKG